MSEEELFNTLKGFDLGTIPYDKYLTLYESSSSYDYYAVKKPLTLNNEYLVKGDKIRINVNMGSWTKYVK